MTWHEVTGQRPDWYSSRHRYYGYDAPMADCDAMYLEYDQGQPRGFAQFRNRLASPPPFLTGQRDPTMRAWWLVASKVGCPFWFGQYWEGSAAFRIYPLNEKAAAMFQVAIGAYRNLTEEEYVRRLYTLRGREAPIAEINEDLIRAGEKPLGRDLPVPDVGECWSPLTTGA